MDFVILSVVVYSDSAAEFAASAHALENVSFPGRFTETADDAQLRESVNRRLPQKVAHLFPKRARVFRQKRVFGSRQSRSGFPAFVSVSEPSLAF